MSDAWVKEEDQVSVAGDLKEPAYVSGLINLFCPYDGTPWSDARRTQIRQEMKNAARPTCKYASIASPASLGLGVFFQARAWNTVSLRKLCERSPREHAL